MDKGSDSKQKAAVREIDFSRLVHEYVAERKLQTPLDTLTSEEKRPVAA